MLENLTKRKGIFYKEDIKEKDQREINLLNTVRKIRDDLDLAYKNFETVTDDALVDSYIYEVQSIQKKYEYYLKEAKKINLMSKIV